MQAASSLSKAWLQERVGTVEKQKNDLMMQQAMMQQQGESSHMMQGSMLGAPFGHGESNWRVPCLRLGAQTMPLTSARAQNAHPCSDGATGSPNLGLCATVSQGSGRGPCPHHVDMTRWSPDAGGVAMGQPVQGMPAAGMHVPQMSGLSAMGFMQAEANGGSAAGMGMSQLSPVSFAHICSYRRPLPL